MNLPLPWLLASVAARTAIIVFVLLAGIRIFGRHGVGDLNVLDLVMILLIGNAVQNALTYGSGHLGVGLVSAATLLLIDRSLGALFLGHPRLERQVFGDPILLVLDGKLDRQALRRARISEESVLAAMRDQGLNELSEVRLAMQEIDGAISIVPKSSGSRQG